ncbi:uncharacterized protein [Phyllobates terribilis]|uniref:uncharacterized protein n=1 Tax=Phyllobates terribilis TaxID=111132 RepID=UPI003CCB142F
MVGQTQSPLQPPIPQAITTNLENKISPSILLIIIILAIIFFISGLLHLLVRFLLKPNNRDPDEVDDVTALQGQLQQLFYLHDAGVDQSFIDNLPLFHYSSVIGVKDPFDCAVCLCEFEPDDRLRLLPKCSHAFHTECIDTWLLSHSTCPLCRSNLLDGMSPGRSSRFPIVCVLESGSDGSREMGQELGRTNSGFGFGFGSDRHEFELPRKSTDSGDKIVTVKLGKFKNMEGSTSESSNNVVDSRRCYSMGSFAYIMDDNSSLQVPIRTPARKLPSMKKPGFIPRSAISEYGCDSRREFQVEGYVRRADSEIELSLNVGDEEDKQSCYSVESTTTNASTTRRTINWLMGRQHNKIVNSSSLSSTNV